MTVAPTQSPAANPAQAPADVPANPKGAMGQDTFLKLLVAELKQQDPMDPMQSRDMVAQLAQLSSVQKLQGIDDKLAAMQTSNNAASAMQNAGLIGRTVTAKTSRLDLNSSGGATGSYQLQSKAQTISVNVRDSSGTVVRALDFAAQQAGQRQFTWDGQTDGGTRAPAGSYSFDVTAKSLQGSPVPASTEVSGLVTEVTNENGAPQVVVGGAHIPLGDVTSIAQ
jgi:flagellar basal-body rod modification protein FlgD